MTDTTPNAPFRKIPSLDSLLCEDAVRWLIGEFGRDVVVAEGRATLDETRAMIASAKAGGSPASAAGGEAAAAADITPENLVTRLRVRLEKKFSPSLSPAVNATGIVMHSGLGRAVLSESAREALAAVAVGYSTLALDPESGKRVSRDRHVEGLLRELTGAEAATVTNNNAAATVLILNTLARGKEVVVSRGQLVEIGGSFRMPDVMATSGAALREVGTTNKTHLRDYESAISESTGAILRVHHSNYRIVGFAEEPGIEELAALGRSRGVPVVDDLGSGALVDLAPYGLAAEPMVRASVQAGADVVCFSGDKLIGGPQCGIIVGKAAWIQKIRKNPLARAFRCGKLSLAALEATLKLFLAPEKLAERHPIYRMLSLTPDELGRRAKKLAASLRKSLSPDVAISVADGESQVGSGAVPVETLPTKVLTVRAPGLTAEELARRLRLLTPPIFARIHKDAVLFDFRTIQPAEDAVVENALIELLK
jgi:L-seryl-tRNA(Ser) seleniumtransferase